MVVKLKEAFVPSNHLRRTYILRGLDRILYASEPQWKDGTFKQDVEHEGRLVLCQENISTAIDLRDAILESDRMAERFRLATSRRTECPLTMALEKSEQPSFDPPSLMRGHSSMRIGAHARGTAFPPEPPTQLEQLSEAASRWVLTLAEAKRFLGYPEETFKRLYLLIEELQVLYTDELDQEQRHDLEEIKWIRDFVSHPVCENQELCAFISQYLPDAVIRTDPKLAIQFDRTKVDHRNFVGRYETKARAIVYPLLDAAIRALDR